jgi:hypothetical protein
MFSSAPVHPVVEFVINETGRMVFIKGKDEFNEYYPAKLRQIKKLNNNVLFIQCGHIKFFLDITDTPQETHLITLYCKYG